MKKFLSLLCCLSLLIFGSNKVFATDNIINQISPTETVEVKSITEEEYLNRKAKYEGKTLEQIKVEHYSKFKTRSSVTDLYKEYSYTKTYEGNSNFKATVIATYHLRGYGNYYDIVGYTGVYSKIAQGTGSSTWVPGNTSISIESPSSSYITANGYFQITLSSSVGSEVEVIPGFSISGSTSWITIYTSDNFNLSRRVTIDDIKYGT